MKKTKFKEKGITLIALVITIVVLIILATVSINMILNEEGGIISAAEKAKELYQNATKEEETDLGNLEEILDNYKEKWVYDEEKQEVTKGSVTLKIGQKIEYNEGTGHKTTPETDRGIGTSYNSSTKTLSAEECTNENLEWRVLGVNTKGQLELISTNITQGALYLYGKQGYLNAETKEGVLGTLDKFCDDLYGKGKGADTARSLNIEDIKKLANFNPETDFDGYNTEYTFEYDNNTKTIKVTDDPTEDINERYDSYESDLYSLDWTVNSSKPGPEKIKKTAYYIRNIQGDFGNSGVSLTNFLFHGETSKNDEDAFQWLSSQCVEVRPVNVPIFAYSVMILNYEQTYWNELYFSDKTESAYSSHLRPIVTLKSDVQIDKDGKIL